MQYNLSEVVLLQRCFKLHVYFFLDESFITTAPFFWKVLVITLVSCLPLYILKFLRRKFAPPNYSKLTEWSIQSNDTVRKLKVFILFKVGKNCTVKFSFSCIYTFRISSDWNSLCDKIFVDSLQNNKSRFFWVAN